MALDPFIIPPGFVDLTSVSNGGFDVQVNTIGVVVDFLPATKSKGADMTIKFTIHDNSWTQGIGLTVRFFQKTEDLLPRIQNNGDVILLRNVKLKAYNGIPTVLSNSSSSWVVLESSSLQESTDPNGSDVTTHSLAKTLNAAMRPSGAEIRYAKALLQLEDASRWQQPAKPTALQVSQIQRANGGAPGAVRDKFAKIEELRVPHHKNDQVYADMFVEVRRMYVPDNDPARVEISVTDYTEHEFLFNYTPENEDPNIPFEGDQFRYLKDTHKKWPGPWGKMTLLVILWPPHRQYALSNVGVGDFVFLKNVHVKLDRDGGKLEGHVHTDRLYESRVNVSIFKPREAASDDRFKALLNRKRDYEEYCKLQRLRFMRDPKEPDASDSKRKDNSHQDSEDSTPLNLKQKRSRDNKKRKRVKANAQRGTNTATENATSDTDTKLPSTNTHVRCNNTAIPLTTITTILSPAILQRSTPSRNPFSLPFQNCVYKSKVRVVDFFPDNLIDFAVPVRESQYAALDDDGDGDSESDIDTSDVDASHPLGSESSESRDGGVKWQWRFMLLVEDARPPVPPRSRSAGAPDDASMPTQMELLVADSDADYLLREIEACDLRRNPKTLARLREKLFVLWGDLQEKKEEILNQQGNEKYEDVGVRGETGVLSELKASARPFECFIKEYGIRNPRRDKEVDESEWERMWRLCFTCI